MVCKRSLVFKVLFTWLDGTLNHLFSFKFGEGNL